MDFVEVDLAGPDEGEVLVRTLFSGISSGTEMLAYRGELDADVELDERIGALSGTFRYPFRYGYSCVGRVDRSHTDEVTEGSLVFAFHPHQDTFLVPADDVVVLSDVEPRVATLLPLVETALQVALDAGPVFQTDVVVMGLGVVGLLSSAMLQRAGARVVAVDPIAWRRSAAGGFGVTAVSPDELADVVAAGTTDGVPLVVEATGRPDALRDCLPLLAHEGTALVVSWYGTKEAVLPLGGHFHRRRLTIRSTQVSTIPAGLAHRWTIPRRRAAASDLLSALPLDTVATHTFPFEEAPEAFAAVDRGEPGLLHAALRYE